MKSQWKLTSFSLIASLSWGGSALAAGELTALDRSETAAATVTEAPGAVAPGQKEAPERREIDLKHIWTGERLTVVYKTGGEYDLDAMARISWFLRDWRCQKSVAIDPALIDVLYGLYRDVGAKGPIWVLSGYRSEGLNASMLRSGRVVDPHSQHMAGKAVDVVFSGASSSTLRNLARAHHAGGVGYYPASRPAFLHVDTGKTRDWEEAPGRRGHQRLRLDCNLTMADALKEVTIERALKALPLGAASEAVERAPSQGAASQGAASQGLASQAGEQAQISSPSVVPVAGEPNPMLIAAAREGVKHGVRQKSERDSKVEGKHRSKTAKVAKLAKNAKISKALKNAKKAKCSKSKSQRAGCAATQARKKKRRR